MLYERNIKTLFLTTPQFRYKNITCWLWDYVNYIHVSKDASCFDFIQIGTKWLG